MGAFVSEAEFERYIRHLLCTSIATRESGIQVLDSKGLGDIIICRDGRPPAVFFVELKYASRTPSGELNPISVSEGIQSEILLGRPHYLDSRFMWLLGSETCKGDYWLMDSKTLLPYITTNPITIGKVNNISLRIFRGDANKHKFSEKELIDSIINFVTEDRT